MEPMCSNFFPVGSLLCFEFKKACSSIGVFTVHKNQLQKKKSLNLVPIMNLVTILIPVLLVAVKVATLVVVESKLPATDCSRCENQPTEESLSLKLMVTKKGISINKDSYQYLWPEGTPSKFLQEDAPPTIPCKTNTCRSETDYNLDELSSALKKIKKEAVAKNHFHKTSQSILLIPEESIPYSILVQIVDIARGDQEERLFPSISFAGSIR